MNEIDKPSRPEWIDVNGTRSDTFTRHQIIQYLNEIPLGYKTERDHEITEELITRIQKHFMILSTDYRMSID